MDEPGQIEVCDAGLGKIELERSQVGGVLEVFLEVKQENLLNFIALDPQPKLLQRLQQSNVVQDFDDVLRL